MQFPLLPAVDDSREVAFGAAGSKTYGELRRLALAFSRVAAAEDRVLVLCEDRFFFAATLLGAKAAGRPVLLPPHRGALARASLAEGSLVARDSDGESGFDLRELAPAEGAFAPTLASTEPFVELFTSGSTGEPERWTKSTRQLLLEAAVVGEILQLDERSRVLATVSAQHIYGLLFGVLAPLGAGAAFSRETPRFSTTIEALARAHCATHLIAVPAHLPGCCAWEGEVRPLLVSSGAPIPGEVATELTTRGFRIVDVLGSSETGGFGYRAMPKDERFRSLPGTSLEVQGEGVLLRSPFLEEPGEPRLLADALELSTDGTFRHLGRSDDVVKIGGKRVALGEIEATARSIPGVIDAWCLADPTEGARGNRLSLLAVAPGYEETLLLERLRALLDGSLLPRRVRLVDEIPTAPSGKRDRRAAATLLDAPVDEGRLVWTSLEVEDNLARTKTRLPRNFPPFRGHFPEEPLLPAVALLEALVVPRIREAFPPLSRVARLERWKLSSPLRPGDEVALSLERKEPRRVDFTVVSGDRVAATGRAYFAEGREEQASRTIEEANFLGARV